MTEPPVGPGGSVRKEIALYGVGRVAVQAAGLASTPFYVRALGPAEFGVLELLTAVILGTTVLSYAWVAPGALRLGFDQSGDSRRRSWSSTLWSALLLQAAMGIALVVLGDDLVDGLDPGDRTRTLLAAGLGMPLYVVHLHALDLAAAWHRPKLHLVAALAGAALASVLAIGLTVVADLGANGVLLAAASGYLLTGLVCYTAIGFSVVRPTLAAAPALAAYGVRLLPFYVATWSMLYVDRFMMLRYRDAADVGEYAIGYKVAAVLAVVVGAIGTAWGPALLRAHRDGRGERLVARALPSTVAATGVAGALLALFAHPLIVIFAGREFAAGAAVVPIVSAGLVALGAATIAQGAFLVMKRPGLQGAIGAAAAGLNIALCLVLVPSHGGLGAAVATGVAYGTQALIAVIVGRRIWRFPVPKEVAIAFGVLALLFVWAARIEPAPVELVARAVTVAVAAAWLARLVGFDFVREIARPLSRRSSHDLQHPLERHL